MERSAGVFDRNGFKASTLDEMVRATGYTRGAFYFHFDSKDALAEAIVIDQQARWTALLESVRLIEPDPLRGLVTFIYASAALHESDVVVRAASRLLSDRVLIARELPSTHPWWIGMARMFLGEASESGQLREDVIGDAGLHRSLDELATYMVWTWHGNQQQTVVSDIDLSLQLRTGWRLLLSSLCRAPEPLTGLLALNDALAERLRTDPAELAQAFGYPPDDPADDPA